MQEKEGSEKSDKDDDEERQEGYKRCLPCLWYCDVQDRRVEWALNLCKAG